MNPVYPVTNFGRVTFAAGFNNAATSLTLATGDGAKLPATSLGSFYLTVWDSFYASAHLDPNRERILVTTRTTDTLSVVVRGQDGTSAQNHNTAGRTYLGELTFGKAEHDKIWENIPDPIIVQDASGQTTLTGLKKLRFPNGQLIVNQLTGEAEIVAVGQIKLTGSIAANTSSCDLVVAGGTENLDCSVEYAQNQNQPSGQLSWTITDIQQDNITITITSSSQDDFDRGIIVRIHSL